MELMPDTERVKAFLCVMILALSRLEFEISLFSFPSQTMKSGGIPERLRHSSAAPSLGALAILRLATTRFLAALGVADELLRGRSGADGGAQGVGEGLAEALNVGVLLGFDHDAGELLGAGVAEHDAAVFAERGSGFGKGAGNFRQRL